MTLWQRWKKVSINNKLMIYMTFILAAATTLYTLMYRSQVKFMEQSARENAEQTNRLVNASERLADTTKNTLEESKRVNKEASDRADRTTKATEMQANASMSQANTSEASAKIARDALVTTNRPYVTAFVVPFAGLEIGELVQNSVKFANDGNGPAQVSARTQFVLSDLPVCPAGIVKATPQQFGMITSLQPSPVSQHREIQAVISSGIPLSEADMKAIKNADKFLLFYGEGSYTGLGGEVPIKWCSQYFWNPSESRGGWRDCLVLPKGTKMRLTRGKGPP